MHPPKTFLIVQYINKQYIFNISRVLILIRWRWRWTACTTSGGKQSGGSTCLPRGDQHHHLGAEHHLGDQHHLGRVVILSIIIMVTVMVVMSRKWWKTNKRLNILYLTLCWKSITMQRSRLSNRPTASASWPAPMEPERMSIWTGSTTLSAVLKMWAMMMLFLICR